MYRKGHASKPAKSLTLLLLALMLSACGMPPPPEAQVPPALEPQGGLVGPDGVVSPDPFPPTQNLSKVAHAFTLSRKSLTTLTTVVSGLSLTRPVEMSIGYYSPAGNGRITQSYVAGTGNHFLYNDFPGDGKPRQLRMDISLSEPKPGGGAWTYAFSWYVNLDPLYGVTLSPLKFTLAEDCDLVGKSEIHLQWISPDDQLHRSSFSMSKEETVAIPNVAWSRSEASAAENLLLPFFFFREIDSAWFPPHVNFYPPIWDPNPRPLLPGQTHTVSTILDEENLQCYAYIEYTLRYTLRFYPFL